MWSVPVNVSGAGEGVLEVMVMVSSCGAVVPHTVKTAGSSVHAVTFTPQIAEPHSAIVKFNSELVTGLSPQLFDVAFSSDGAPADPRDHVSI